MQARGPVPRIRKAAYFGIVPRVSNSNQTEHTGRITKRGTKLGRTTLIQCALIAQRYSPYLKTYYEKTPGAGGEQEETARVPVSAEAGRDIRKRQYSKTATSGRRC